MALFVLLGVLRGFPAAAYRRTAHRKPLCGLDQNKNCSFPNWTPVVFILNQWMDTNYKFARKLSQIDILANLKLEFYKRHRICWIARMLYYAIKTAPMQPESSY